jgi:hypothetical protein
MLSSSSTSRFTKPSGTDIPRSRASIVSWRTPTRNLTRVLLPAVVVAMCGTALAQASGSSVLARSAAGPSATLTASLITSSPLGTLKPGTAVRARTLGTRVFTDSIHGFALATERFGAAYPAVTTNGGKTWRINGPVLHVPAAQAPFAVTHVGAANATTYFAWGAQSIDATSDSGRHWWRTLVNDSALAVVATGRTLIAMVDAAPAGGTGSATTSVYLSSDGGHHWRLTHQLQGV